MQLQRNSELNDKGKLLLLRDLFDHQNIKVTNSIHEVLVNKEDGHVTW